MMQARNLQEVTREVEGFRDALGHPMDLKIIPLVIGLQRWGVKTTMSCQGHPDALRFPWVMIEWNSLPLACALVMQNYSDKLLSSSNIVWVLEPWVSPRIRTREQGLWKLPRLQQEAIALGVFLQTIPDDYFAAAPFFATL
ncbi:MAG: hypothetical protein HY482_00585 [Candidatus Wildermuthbacteria bacterium]|nr:hypothetical protein [Candidatus Wildermuthbacteria bacterium]